MSKIAIISKSNVSFSGKFVQDGFIEGFANTFARMGNDVKCYIIHPDLEKSSKKDLITFNPDLIISFNNVFMSKHLLDVVSCPICVFGYDSVSFWENIDIIKENYDRYYFLHHGEDTYSQAHELLPDALESHHFIFGYASDLRKKDILQDIEISFIGGLGNWNKSLSKYFMELYYGKKDFCLNDIKDDIIKDIEKLSKNHLSIIEKVPEYWEKLNLMSYKQTIILNLTALKRFDVLRSLTDLGLKVFSYPQFIDVITWDLELAKAFDFTPSVSLEDSEYNFNRSKISLNLPHAHAQNGFSCRVCAIMASNACLLSDYRRDLDLLMKPYINFPMFKSTAEARELAEKLLKDDVWRKDIVAASQQMIEENCRFEKKIMQMQDFIGISLKNENETGKKECFFDKLRNIDVYHNRPKTIKDKIIYKIWKHIGKTLKKKGFIP